MPPRKLLRLAFLTLLFLWNGSGEANSEPGPRNAIFGGILGYGIGLGYERLLSDRFSTRLAATYAPLASFCCNNGYSGKDQIESLSLGGRYYLSGESMRGWYLDAHLAFLRAETRYVLDVRTPTGPEPPAEHVDYFSVMVLGSYQWLLWGHLTVSPGIGIRNVILFNSTYPRDRSYFDFAGLYPQAELSMGWAY